LGVPKRKYEIWFRDATGEKLSPWDSTWDTEELARREISRRDVPRGGEYFIKEKIMGRPSGPLGLKQTEGPSLGRKNRFSI